jgi:peptide/nickel transport system substrate-binding protein
MAHGDNVTHAEKVAANWNDDGCKIAERWWFA